MKYGNLRKGFDKKKHNPIFIFPLVIQNDLTY